MPCCPRQGQVTCQKFLELLAFPSLPNQRPHHNELGCFVHKISISVSNIHNTQEKTTFHLLLDTELSFPSWESRETGRAAIPPLLPLTSSSMLSCGSPALLLCWHCTKVQSCPRICLSKSNLAGLRLSKPPCTQELPLVLYTMLSTKAVSQTSPESNVPSMLCSRLFQTVTC